MSNASDILNSKFPSPTKRAGAVIGSGSASYTATSPVKITMVNALSGASVTVDGISFNNQGEVRYTLGNGQSTSVISSSGGFLLSVERIS